MFGFDLCYILLLLLLYYYITHTNPTLYAPCGGSSQQVSALVHPSFRKLDMAPTYWIHWDGLNKLQTLKQVYYPMKPRHNLINFPINPHWTKKTWNKNPQITFFHHFSKFSSGFFTLIFSTPPRPPHLQEGSHLHQADKDAQLRPWLVAHQVGLKTQNTDRYGAQGQDDLIEIVL